MNLQGEKIQKCSGFVMPHCSKKKCETFVQKEDEKKCERNQEPQNSSKEIMKNSTCAAVQVIKKHQDMENKFTLWRNEYGRPEDRLLMKAPPVEDSKRREERGAPPDTRAVVE